MYYDDRTQKTDQKIVEKSGFRLGFNKAKGKDTADGTRWCYYNK